MSLETLAVQPEKSTEVQVLEEWIGDHPAPAGTLLNRRSYTGDSPAVERRQFTNSHEGLSPDGRELAIAIDRYKLTNRRRFITYDEILNIVISLGYSRQ
ncbi:MAG: hypothetical protein SFX18_17870 [Pirellulales bacterium]|nr:hypothetical protein [Pirellulales bacterium]